METFFETEKFGESLRGHTWYQLFITDKDFGSFVIMKLNGKVQQAVK